MATVAEMILTQQAYATQAVVDVQGFIAPLLALTTLAPIDIDFVPNPDYISIFDPGMAQGQMLSFRPVPGFVIGDITGTLPTLDPSSFTPVGDITVPDFNETAPALNIPLPPDTDLPTPPTAPTITDPTIPDSPVLDMPTAPTLTAIVLPSPPAIDIPVFTSTAPIDDLVIPSTNFQFYEIPYESALLDELKRKLLFDMINGSYGIEPSDEISLYERARDREMEAANTDMDGVFAQQAARGFPLPPGDLNVALQRARQLLTNKLSSISRDIMIKRNEEFVAARKFTIEQAKGLEQILIGYHSSVMERALNAAKATLEASISIFNLSVARFNALYGAYGIEAQIFEARIRAALAQVQIFSVQMEGKKIESELQKNQVDVYRAQLEAVNTVVNLYKTQMEAAQIQSNIERTRIDAFRALIDAYTSQVQAKVAEFNMYDSQIKGELAKVQVYEAQARAYSSVVEGLKVRSDILIARLRAEIDEAGHGVEVYKAKIDAYRADLQGQAASIQGHVSGYQADIAAYSAQVNAMSESYRLEQQAVQLENTSQQRIAEIAIENAKMQFQGILAPLQIRLNAGEAGAKVYAGIANSALNSINTLAGQIEQSTPVA